MPDMGLIKEFLDNPTLIIKLTDVFSDEEIFGDTRNFIPCTTFEALRQHMADWLNDESLIIANGFDDMEVISDEMKVEHGLSYLDDAIKAIREGFEVVEIMHSFIPIELGGLTNYVCFETKYENHGMGGDEVFDDARIDGVFKTIDAVEGYYRARGWLLMKDFDVGSNPGMFKDFILTNWNQGG